ncbi:hypothetical protein QR680_003810 [Steinernema hermaphroditum]|uniref:J domain-containing protein n=1 Tax=Steinernema hermaphroditum TaxID=289476 RepID=A0AA39HMN6_9BILA|nr:hypothetical protein QR680_003810 [Steinernema hermaphroditum]
MLHFTYDCVSRAQNTAANSTSSPSAAHSFATANNITCSSRPSAARRRHSRSMALLAVRRICTKVEFRINPAVYAQDRRTDHEILGVPKSADADQIQKAYRNMLRKYHPWQYGVKNDSEITEQFIQKKVAYLQLMDQEKTWHKRLRHRFARLYNYIATVLLAIGFYEALRYLAREMYKRYLIANRLVTDERRKLVALKST